MGRKQTTQINESKYALLEKSQLEGTEYFNRKTRLTDNNADLDGDPLNKLLLDAADKQLVRLDQLSHPRGYATDIENNIFSEMLHGDNQSARYNQSNMDYYRAGAFAKKGFLGDVQQWPRYELQGLDLSSWNEIFLTQNIGMPYPRCTFITSKEVLVFGLEMSMHGFSFKVLPKTKYLPIWVGEFGWEVDIVSKPTIAEGFGMQIAPFRIEGWSVSDSEDHWQSIQSDVESHARVREAIREVLGFLYFRATRRIETQPIRGPINKNVPTACEGDAYRIVKVDLSTQYSTSTPKGGTHASPREHQREAHWRTYKSGKRIRIEAQTINKGVSKGTIKKHYEVC